MFSGMKLGKLAARRDPRTLKMSRYLTPKLAPAPHEFSLTAKLSHLGMMVNDRLGDCTIATVGHMIQTWTANVGSQIIIPDADIVTMYEAACGYNPADPNTDQGGIELDVLNFWRKNPVDNNPLQAYAYLAPHQTEEIRQSIYYFGGAYLGIQLPLTAQNQQVWTVTSLTGDGAPGTWGGHAVPIVAYDQHYVT